MYKNIMKKYVIIVTFINNKMKRIETNNRHFAQYLMNNFIERDEIKNAQLRIVRL